MDKSIHSPEYQIFIKLLRETRERAGLTQDDIANSLKTTQTVVSKSERAERRIDIVELALWCSAMKVSLTDFVKVFEDKLPPRTR